jgi:hypothetical protein
MPYISTAQYKRLVEYYFEREFSDRPIAAVILMTTRVERKTGSYWERKVRIAIELHRATNKHPSDAAAFLSRLFKPRLKQLVEDVF